MGYNSGAVRSGSQPNSSAPSRSSFTSAKLKPNSRTGGGKCSDQDSQNSWRLSLKACFVNGLGDCTETGSVDQALDSSTCKYCAGTCLSSIIPSIISRQQLFPALVNFANGIDTHRTELKRRAEKIKRRVLQTSRNQNRPDRGKQNDTAPRSAEADDTDADAAYEYMADSMASILRKLTGKLCRCGKNSLSSNVSVIPRIVSDFGQQSVNQFLRSLVNAAIDEIRLEMKYQDALLAITELIETSSDAAIYSEHQKCWSDLPSPLKWTWAVPAVCFLTKHTHLCRFLADSSRLNHLLSLSCKCWGYSGSLVIESFASASQCSDVHKTMLALSSWPEVLLSAMEQVSSHGQVKSDPDSAWSVDSISTSSTLMERSDGTALQSQSTPSGREAAIDGPNPEVSTGSAIDERSTKKSGGILGFLKRKSSRKPSDANSGTKNASGNKEEVVQGRSAGGSQGREPDVEILHSHDDDGRKLSMHVNSARIDSNATIYSLKRQNYRFGGEGYDPAYTYDLSFEHLQNIPALFILDDLTRLQTFDSLVTMAATRPTFIASAVPVFALISDLTVWGELLHLPGTKFLHRCKQLQACRFLMHPRS